MKKKLAIVLCALLAAAGVLAGCGGNETGKVESGVSSTVSQEQPTYSTTGEVKNDPNLPMSVSEQLYPKGGINVAFLVVENMENPAIQSNVNTLIQNDMINRLDAYLKANAEYKGDLKSEVVRNDGKILSIVTSGTLSAPKAASPINVVYTTNIDLATAKRTPTVVAEKAADIADILLSGKDYTIKGTEEQQEAVKKALMETKKETLVANLTVTDLGSDADAKNKEPVCFSYQVDDSHVVIYMPVDHALGDFAAITVNLNREEAKAAQSSTSQASSAAAGAASSKANTPASSASSGAAKTK